MKSHCAHSARSASLSAVLARAVLGCLLVLVGGANALGQPADIVNNLSSARTSFTSIRLGRDAAQTFTVDNNSYTVSAIIVSLSLAAGESGATAEIYLDNISQGSVLVTDGTAFRQLQVAACGFLAANSTHTVSVRTAGGNTGNGVDWAVGGASLSGGGTLGNAADTLGSPIGGKYKVAVGGNRISTTPLIAFTEPDTHPSQAEGTGGGTAFVFPLRRTVNVSGVSTVNWAVTGFGVNPANAADFVGNAFPSGTVTFAAGESAKDITINVNGDSAVEPDEQFLVTLSGAVGALISGVTQNFGTIQNDDVFVPAQLDIAATDADKAEGNTGVTPFTFTVTRSANVGTAVQVNWAVSAVGFGSVDGNDFSPPGLPSGTLSFAANETSKLITVNVAGDTIPEPDEPFTVTLSSPSAGATIGTAAATGTIRDDDVNLSIMATLANRSEGNSGPKPFRFVIQRTAFGSQVVNAVSVFLVNWAVTGSASSGAVSAAVAADFTGNALTNGTVTFAAGENQKEIDVLVAGNTTAQGDREFTVTLSNPTGGARITTATALGTIHDDDTNPAIIDTLPSPDENTIDIDPFFFVTARNIGFTTDNQPYQLDSIVVPMQFFGGGSTMVQIELHADAAGAPGALLEGWSVDSGTSFFLQVTNVSVARPGLAANTKYWLVVQSAGALGISASAHADNFGTGTLNEVVPPPFTPGLLPRFAVRGLSGAQLVASFSVAASDATKAEGNPGSSTPFTFTVTRSGVLTNANSVSWAVTGSGVRPANYADFTGGVFPSGTLNFAPSETVKTITVNVAGDLLAEQNETFTVTLANATAGAQIAGATAIGTILGDDAELRLEVLNADRLENAAGPFQFQVRRIGATNGVTTVQWAVTGGPVHPANAADFVGGALPTGTITFNAGETVKALDVNVAGDSVVEPDETFVVTLSSPSAGARVVVASAGGIIRNDDTAVAIAALDADKLEGNSGSTPFTFLLTRTGALTGPTTVNYAVAGSGPSQANGADFVGGALPTGTVTFNAGAATATLTINVSGDAASEADEGFTVTISNPTGGATIGTATAAGMIRNDDAAGGMVIVNSFANNPTGGFDPVSQPNIQSQSFTNGPQDLVLGSVSLRLFCQNAPAITVEVLLLAGDGPPQTNFFGMALSPTPGAVLATVGTAQVTSQGAGTLAQDEITVNAISNVTLRANTKYWIGVHPTAPAGAFVAVDSWFDANPVQGVGTMGSTSGDQIFHSATGFVLGGSFLVVQAAAPAAAPTLAIAANNADQAEGNSGVTPFTFTITRGGVTGGSTTVNWAVTGGGINAADAADFENGVFPGGSVTFAPGGTSKSISVNVRGDASVEPDEEFVVTLSGATGGAQIISGSASGIIRNDDTTIGIVATDADKPEGTGGVTPFVFTLTRSGKADVQHSVNWAMTGSGTFAAEANDFAGGVLTNGTVIFAPGEISKDIAVLVNADADNERDETFTVTLSGASAGVIVTTSTATGTIRNDDPLAITRAGGNLQITWGVGAGQASGFVLEFTDSLLPPVIWTTVPQPPAVGDGQASTTLPLQGSGRFYRLRKLP